LANTLCDKISTLKVTYTFIEKIVRTGNDFELLKTHKTKTIQLLGRR